MSQDIRTGSGGIGRISFRYMPITRSIRHNIKLYVSLLFLTLDKFALQTSACALNLSSLGPRDTNNSVFKFKVQQCLVVRSLCSSLCCAASMPRPQAAHKTYAKALIQKLHGYPLWEPDPGSYAAVEIADVGYISRGAFIKLFNASKDANDPSNRLGLPDGHTPLVIGEVQRTTALSKEDHISSEGVSLIGAEITA
jgi:hypothetical protein